MANPATDTKTEAASDPQKDVQAPAETKVKKKFNPFGFFSKLSPREKAIAGAAGFILLFLILDWVMFKPIGKHLDALTAATREKENLIPKKLSVLSRKEEIEKSYKAVSGYLTDSKMSREEEIAAYLGEIESVSQKIGLFISNINPVQTEEAGLAYHLKVDVEGAGSIANIKKFMSSLEETNPSIRVAGFSLRGQGANTDELRFRFSIEKLGLKNKA